jgi:hypothetical protein
MENRRVDGVVNHDRMVQVKPELTVLVQAEARLQNGRVSEVTIDSGDPTVGSVVETSVHADRTIDPVHHADAVADETPQTREVEIERVEKAGVCPARESVDLHDETAALQLPRERKQELVPAAVRRRPEVVENGQIGGSATRTQPIGFGSTAACERPHRLCGVAQQGSHGLQSGHLPLNRRFTTRAETSPDTLGDPR